MIAMRWSLMLLVLGPPLARQAYAQSDYRNLEAGLPVRIEDAIVTERYALDFDLANIRFDALSGGRKRLQFEPELSYGILPRTEMWLRATTYYREKEITPRKGIAGVGIGSMYQFNVETLHVPAFGLASEIFLPTGPNALPASYSLKAALTKSFTTGRLHFNGSIASYSTRTVATDCLALPQGSVCPNAQAVGVLPPLDGPCIMAPVEAKQFYPSPAEVKALSALPLTSNAITAGSTTQTVTHGHWLVGIGADKTLPLSSIVFVGDLFAEKFEGIGRPTDWTTEVGARKQLTPSVVVVGSVGRHFKGVNDSVFFILGATFSRAMQYFEGSR
jgi:hypothetical protein